MTITRAEGEVVKQNKQKQTTKRWMGGEEIRELIKEDEKN